MNRINVAAKQVTRALPAHGLHLVVQRIAVHIPRGSNQRLSKVVQNVKKCQKKTTKINKMSSNMCQKPVPISLHVVLCLQLWTTPKPSGYASHASHDHFSPLWSEGHGSRLDSRLAKSNVGQVETFQPSVEIGKAIVRL